MLYNIEAEQSLLGCLLMEHDLIKEITLRPEHFYIEKNQAIFTAMRMAEQKGEPTDFVTVYSLLSTGAKNLVDLDYLTALSTSVVSTVPYKSYEKYIFEAWKCRKAKAIAHNLDVALDYQADSQTILDAADKLTRLMELGHDHDFDIKTALMSLQESLESDQVGVLSGYYDLDTFSNGFAKGDLIVVGARPSVGKTALALNIGTNASKKGTVVSIFSLEMSEHSLLKRIISAEAKIDATRMRDPKKFFSDSDWEKYIDSTASISTLPLHIYDNPSVTVHEIRAKVRNLIRKYPDQNHLCIIDYLQLITGDGRENRTLEIGTISRSLKIMARELDMPVIVLSQLSRNLEHRQDKRPMLSDLRDSGSIEQDADVIVFLYRDDYYNPESDAKNLVEIIVAKQRNGPTGRVKLAFLKEYNLFTNLARS